LRRLRESKAVFFTLPAVLAACESFPMPGFFALILEMIVLELAMPATIDPSATQARGPGRPREFDIEDALDKEVGVFCERGFHATSITDLSRAMELTAGSLYKAFKDKRDVFLAALDRQAGQRSRELLCAVEQGRDGRDRLRRALAF